MNNQGINDIVAHAYGLLADTGKVPYPTRLHRHLWEAHRFSLAQVTNAYKRLVYSGRIRKVVGREPRGKRAEEAEILRRPIVNRHEFSEDARKQAKVLRWARALKRKIEIDRERRAG